MSTLAPGKPTSIPRYPIASYYLRVKAEPKFELSKEKQNKMLVFTFEVVGDINRNPIVTVDGNSYEVSGQEFKSWMLVEQNMTRTFEAFLRSCCIVQKDDSLLPKLGDIVFNENDGMPYRQDGTPIKFAGLECLAELGSKSKDRLGDDGKVLINPITGKPKTFVNHEIRGFDTD